MLENIFNKFRGDQHPGSPSLKARIVKGGVLLGLGSGGEQVLRLLRNIMLTRILAPDVFGQMAIIMAVIATLESFTEVGIKQAVIQNPDSEDERYLNGAWWLALSRSTGLFIVGVVSAPLIGDFYHISQHVRLLQLSFLTILFNGAFSARAYIALKRMEYRKWILISNGGGACGILTSIVCSLVLQSVQALVIGYIVEAGARCILSYVTCPFVPGFRFNKKHSEDLFRYARGMFGLPILYFVFTQTPVFVLGKIVSKADLGFYSMSFSLAQAPGQLLANLMNQTLMPAFSSKQDDNVWINRAIIRATRIVVFVGIPVVFFVALYAKILLSIIYGPAYAVVSVPFALLFLSAMLSTFSIPIVNVYLAIARPHFHRLFSGVRAAILVVLIYPAIHFGGLAGAASAVCTAMAVGYLFQVMQLRKLTSLDTLKYGSIYLYSLFIALVVVFIRVAVNGLFPNNPAMMLLSGMMGCAAVYGLLGAIVLKSEKARKLFSRMETIACQ